MMRYIISLFTLTMSSLLSTSAFSTFVANVSDQCVCYGKENAYYKEIDIDYCEKGSAPRLTAVAQEIRERNLRIIKPGETSEQIIQDSMQYYTYARSPGFNNKPVDGMTFYFNNRDDIFYSVTVYYLEKGRFPRGYTFNTLLLKWDGETKFTPTLELQNCTYRPGENPAGSYDPHKRVWIQK